jgi:hypothetical protein
MSPGVDTLLHRSLCPTAKKAGYLVTVSVPDRAIGAAIAFPAFTENSVLYPIALRVDA